MKTISSKKIGLPLFVCAGSLVLAGCSTTTLYFAPDLKAGQRSVQETAAAGMVGIQEVRMGVQSEVSFIPTAGDAMFDGMAVFWVLAANIDHAPFRFGVESITVEDNNGKPVEVLTLNRITERMRTTKSQKEWAYLMVSSVLNSLAAAPYATSQQTGTYGGYASDGRYVSGSYSGTSTNPTAQYLAQQQTSAQSAAFDAKSDSIYMRAVNSLNGLSLNAKLVEPGQTNDGIIALPLPSSHSVPTKYRVKIRINDTTFVHVFYISNAK